MLRKVLYSAVFSWIMLTIPVAFAQETKHEHDTVVELAQIMLRFNHQVSDADKVTLDKIISDEQLSADERTVAQVLKNLDNKAGPADRAKLKAIIDDKKAQAELRELASIALDIDNKIVAAHKKRLESLIKVKQVSPAH